MTSLLLRHLPDIYLLYGFSFLLLASSVALQPRGFESKLERNLWLLGLFGLTHGVHELLEWAILTYPQFCPRICPPSMAFLAASYFALFEFGRRMLTEAGGVFTVLKGRYLWPALLAAAAAGIALSPDRWTGTNVALRVFFGLPGAWLTGAAFVVKSLELGSNHGASMRFCPSSMGGGVVFMVYGLATVITKTEGLPLWAWLPDGQTFLAATGLPIQLVRTACALSSAVCVSFVIRTQNQRIRQHELSLTRELNALNASLEDRIRNRTLDLKAANIELERQFETQKKIVDELMRRESLVRTIFDQVAVGVTFIDADGRYFRVNDRFAGILGLPRDAIVGKHFSTYTHPQDVEADVESWKNMRKSTERFSAREKRYLRPDGSSIWCSVTVSAVQDDAGRFLHYLGVVIDINERQQAAAAQKESAKRLRLALSAARQGMFEFDLRERSVDVTCAPGDEKAGVDFQGTFENWLSRIHPEDRPRAQALARQLNSGQQNGLHITLEFRRKHADGGWRWVLATGSRIDDVETGSVRILGTHVDITEQKAVERRLLRSQRLESIGQLAAGISHDLNNSLVPIITGLSVIRQKIHREDLELFSAIELSARRTAEMGRQLLSFAKGADGRKLLLKPNELLNEMLKFMSTTFPKNIVLSCSCPYRDSRQPKQKIPPKLEGCNGCVEENTRIMGDPTQLHQVLLNLCINARDAMPHGGDLKMELDFREVDQAMATENGGVALGQYACISVVDSGTGIPASVLDRIFDPFFTTKGPEKGTGLGLSTVLGIVRGHGGFITVDTEEERGTSFHVFLPLVHQETPPSPHGGI